MKRVAHLSYEFVKWLTLVIAMAHLLLVRLIIERLKYLVPVSTEQANEIS